MEAWFFESSSSSSSDEDELLFLLSEERENGGGLEDAMDVCKTSSSSSSIDDDAVLYAVKRTRPKIYNYLENTVLFCEFRYHVLYIRDYKNVIKIRRYLCVQFKQTFRVSRKMARKLIKEYEQSEFHPSGMGLGGSDCKTAREDILSFLCALKPASFYPQTRTGNRLVSILVCGWELAGFAPLLKKKNLILNKQHVTLRRFAGNKCCLRDVAERFGTGLGTCFNQHIRVMNFLLHLAPSIIKFPNHLEEAARKFEQISGFPNVVGCIDGSHIPIRTPAGKMKHTYVNRHDCPSLTLQAICDVDKKFIDVFTGVPGKAHDARVLQFSDINDELPEICGEQYHLLGDGAYALRPWLLVPYKDLGHMTHEERIYNTKFCATRVLIENAFGLLKGRFRQLALLVDMHKVDKMCRFIISCCVLHNLCIDEQDVCDFAAPVNDEGDEHPEPCDLVEGDIALRAMGARKRDFIKQMFI